MGSWPIMWRGRVVVPPRRATPLALGALQRPIRWRSGWLFPPFIKRGCVWVAYLLISTGYICQKIISYWHAAVQFLCGGLFGAVGWII